MLLFFLKCGFLFVLSLCFWLRSCSILILNLLSFSLLLWLSVISGLCVFVLIFSLLLILVDYFLLILSIHLILLPFLIVHLLVVFYLFHNGHVRLVTHVDLLTSHLDGLHEGIVIDFWEKLSHLFGS